MPKTAIDWTTKVNEWGTLDTADVAKIIRLKLAERFPGYKFSVRISRYSGGSTIDVKWRDGPSYHDVHAVTGGYRSGGFDGMIDMQYSSQEWLLPDGSVTRASSSGTEGSRGTVPGYAHESPHPDAVKVRLGNNFLFPDRDFSPDAFRWAVNELHLAQRVVVNTYEHNGSGWVFTSLPEDDYRIRRLLGSTTFTPDGEPVKEEDDASV